MMIKSRIVSYYIMYGECSGAAKNMYSAALTGGVLWLSVRFTCYGTTAKSLLLLCPCDLFLMKVECVSPQQLLYLLLRSYNTLIYIIGLFSVISTHIYSFYTFWLNQFFNQFFTSFYIFVSKYVFSDIIVSVLAGVWLHFA